MTARDKTPVVIFGAGGYGGVGLVENLLQHPFIRLAALVSREGAGRPYHELYPHLKGRTDLVVEDAEGFAPEGRGRFVFFSTPDGVGQQHARRFLDAGYRIIDFSGDFRFPDGATYARYAKRQKVAEKHHAEDLLAHAVYACPELHRKELKKADIAGNPGCMAMGCLLALAPVLKARLVEPRSIICDVKTGISGAGKKPQPAYHFPAALENSYAYKIGRHQHVIELERELTRLAGAEVTLDFTPHVIPASRGILSTCYARLTHKAESKAIENAYTGFCHREPFVDVELSGRNLELHEVRGGNECRIAFHVSERTATLVVVSVLDNLQKGQSGNAVQAMNIMLGFPETAGLDAVPRFP